MRRVDVDTRAPGQERWRTLSSDREADEFLRGPIGVSLPEELVLAVRRGEPVILARRFVEFRIRPARTAEEREAERRAQHAAAMSWGEDDPDTEPREQGCECHWEAGDSPCPVHGYDCEPTLAAAHLRGIDVERHRCDCEVCSKTSRLCSGTIASLRAEAESEDATIGRSGRCSRCGGLAAFQTADGCESCIDDDEPTGEGLWGNGGAGAEGGA